MAVYLSFLLIAFGLTGIYSITTVSKVSVEAGHSFTIPCIYDAQYINHVKYLCRGRTWSSCSFAVKSDQPHSSGKLAISDDKSKRIFTVTIKDLRNEDADYYWCGVEIDYKVDDGALFHLSVSKGSPSLYLDQQEVRGFIGNNMTIHFNSSMSEDIKWCRLGGSCVRGSSGSIDGTKVTINRMHSVFTVTMSGLMTESSGWYLCAQGDLQIPVHLTVTEKPSTTTISLSYAHTTVNGDKAITTLKNGQHSSTVDLKSLIIPLTLLVFVVMVALVIWFELKRHKQNKVKSSDATKAEEEVTYCDVKHMSKPSAHHTAGDDVIYCNVAHGRQTSGQTSSTDVDVMYSTVVIKKQRSVKRVEAQD